MRIAILGIIVENEDSVAELNALLHQYASAVIGRMGIPFREKNVSVISVALYADMNTISALSGKAGRIPGVSAKVTYSAAAY